MSKNRADFLKECMSDPALVTSPVPIDEFQRNYCIVCANRECARSSANNLAFDRRVANWESTLFTNAPRAKDDDPNFVRIRSKNFAPVIESMGVRINRGF